MSEPTVRVTCYQVSVLPESHIDQDVFAITVEYRGHGRWAVKHLAYVLSGTGEWDYEPNPSSRTDEWLARHRFTRDEALELAKQCAPRVTVNGYTAAQAAQIERGQR